MVPGSSETGREAFPAGGCQGGTEAVGSLLPVGTDNGQALVQVAGQLAQAII